MFEKIVIFWFKDNRVKYVKFFCKELICDILLNIKKDFVYSLFFYFIVVIETIKWLVFIINIIYLFYKKVWYFLEMKYNSILKFRGDFFFGDLEYLLIIILIRKFY